MTCSSFPNKPEPGLLDKEFLRLSSAAGKTGVPATGSCPNPAGEEWEVWEVWCAAPKCWMNGSQNVREARASLRNWSSSTHVVSLSPDWRA